MRLIIISKILLIISLPILILLLSADFAAFNNLFYQEKFSEYGVHKEVPQADLLHQRVIGFLKGTSNELPPDFNERERQHLFDVRKIVNVSTILLYILSALFVILLIASALMLKINHLILKFIGKVLLFGGILAMILAAALLFFINSDFSDSFESFHNMLFQKGTYTFDPSKEIIVRLYPEQLFMDFGIRISEFVVIGSAVVILTGALFLLPYKKRFK